MYKTIQLCDLMNYSKANTCVAPPLGQVTDLCHYPGSPSRSPIPTTVPFLSPLTSNQYPIFTVFLFHSNMHPLTLQFSFGHLKNFHMSFKSLSLLSYHLEVSPAFLHFSFNLSGRTSSFDLQRFPQSGFADCIFMSNSPSSCKLMAGPRDCLGFRFDFFGKTTGGM